MRINKDSYFKHEDLFRNVHVKKNINLHPFNKNIKKQKLWHGYLVYPTLSHRSSYPIPSLEPGHMKI